MHPHAQVAVDLHLPRRSAEHQPGPQARELRKRVQRVRAGRGAGGVPAHAAVRPATGGLGRPDCLDGGGHRRCVGVPAPTNQSVQLRCEQPIWIVQQIGRHNLIVGLATTLLCTR